MDTIHCSTQVRQLDKKQDFTILLEGIDIETGYPWKGGILIDGHGNPNNDFMNKIKEIDYTLFVSHTEPIPFLHEEMNKKFKNEKYANNGMAFILVKVYENTIQTFSIGDSYVYIFKNNELLYRNIGHTLENKLERERLEGKMKIINSHKPCIFDHNKIFMEKSYYALFHGTNKQIALTQTFGNNDITGIQPEIFMCDYSPEDKIRIIVGSDGYFDLHSDNNELDMNDLKNLSCEELMNKAEKRWKQEWMFYIDKTKDDYTIQKFPYYDDVSILLIEKFSTK
jgi:serine/threonine protein phosphatase PrpC